MGEDVTLVDSAEETAKRTEDILRSRGLFREDSKRRDVSFYLTDDSETFTSVASRFLGKPLGKAEVVDIV